MKSQTKEIENAQILGISVEDYLENKKEHDLFLAMIALNNDANHNPYEGWTREETRHFEDKFHKQPLVGTFTDAPITTTAEIDAEFERAFKGKTFEELFDD